MGMIKRIKGATSVTYPSDPRKDPMIVVGLWINRPKVYRYALWIS